MGQKFDIKYNQEKVRRGMAMKKRVLTLLLLFSMIIAFSVAYSQMTIWVCSNHQPKHVATTIDEMQELTKEYGCEGWYLLR